MNADKKRTSKKLNKFLTTKNRKKQKVYGIAFIMAELQDSRADFYQKKIRANPRRPAAKMF